MNKSKKPQTVSGVFFARVIELCADTRGSALAITLAFFMPVYLAVIGIYGVGATVRNKIELQNAVDAAAYSAAVVQADYLSRMATVNKAMAWTYIDLQKRSLDLAMDLYVAFVVKQFIADFNKCRTENLPCHPHVPSVNYNCGYNILVNKVSLLLGAGWGVPGLARKFNGQEGKLQRFLANHAFQVGKANIQGKGSITNIPKVLSYSKSLISMTKKLWDLKKEYPKKVRETALQIANANMMECKDDYIINVKLGNENLSFFTMLSNEENEKAFIAMGDPTLKDFSPKKVFGSGTDDWIQRSSKMPVGFWRVYKQQKEHLYTEWDWFWTKWYHISAGPIQVCCPPGAPFVPSKYDWGTRRYHGYDIDVKLIKNDLPIGLLVTPALPFTLTPEFFGKSGSITVAIARKNPNPLGLFSSSGEKAMTASGILSAFNPTVAGGSRPEYMCAVASARAGYKLYDKDEEKKKKSTDYTVGYVKADLEKTWNLSETDWDAVMLPVKYAWSLCAGKEQMQTFMPDPLGGGNILSDIMLDKENWVDKDGKKVKGDRLPKWDKLQAPGGLVKDTKSKGDKLDWAKLKDYLGH